MVICPSNVLRRKVIVTIVNTIIRRRINIEQVTFRDEDTKDNGERIRKKRKISSASLLQ